MNWFYNLKIGAKLLIGFILVAIIAGVVGVFGIVNLKTIEREYGILFDDYGKPLADIGLVGIYFHRIRVNLRDIVLDQQCKKEEAAKKIGNFDAIMDLKLKNFEKTIKSTKVRQEFNALKSLIDKYQPIQDRMIKLAIDGRYDEAKAIMSGEGFEIALNIQDGIENLLQGKIDTGNNKSANLTDATNRTIAIMLFIVIAAMIIAFCLGIFLARIISKPVIQLVDSATRIALGDVNVNVTSSTKDEIGNLMDAFSRMIDNIREQAKAVEKIAEGDLTVEVKVRSDQDLLGKKLAEMVQTNNEVLGSINVSAEQVSAGARQVSVSSQALSQGSSEQASSIEEITASIAEIAAQTKQNAVNAGQANELANTAKTNAVQGNEQMREMLKAMDEINESSGNISKIIKVIDEIAFQTNILALNAAVEAARAGQHGKGFAVVAEEVRNLAARSANAAKETTDLIEGSIKKVEAGTRIANETATALNQIVDGISRAANLVGDIAEASNEQATGIAQVNQGIEQVSQVTQSNTATAEESASASEELSSQAEMLKSMVANFRLKQTGQSYDKIKNINPDILKAIEDMMQKKNSQLDAMSMSQVEAAATAAKKKKVKIALDDNEFGKY